MAGLWERFEIDPRRPENASMRASDRDRDLVNELLGEAFADGRLDHDEFDERAGRVASAKTLGELPPVVSDLIAPAGAAPAVPQDRRADAELRYRRMRQQALGAFLMPTIICWVVYLSVLGHTGGHAWFPWPVFVTLGTGMRFFQLTFSKQDTISSLERSMQRRDQRRVERTQRRELRRGPFPPAPHGQS